MALPRALWPNEAEFARNQTVFLTNCPERMALSPLPSFASSIMVTQLRMMVHVMTVSKAFDMQTHVARRLSGLDGVKRKSEVGPWSSTVSPFFRTILYDDNGCGGRRRRRQPRRCGTSCCCCCRRRCGSVVMGEDIGREGERRSTSRTRVRRLTTAEGAKTEQCLLLLLLVF